MKNTVHKILTSSAAALATVFAVMALVFYVIHLEQQSQVQVGTFQRVSGKVFLNTVGETMVVASLASLMSADRVYLDSDSQGLFRYLPEFGILNLEITGPGYLTATQTGELQIESPGFIIITGELNQKINLQLRNEEDIIVEENSVIQGETGAAGSILKVIQGQLKYNQQSINPNDKPLILN